MSKIINRIRLREAMKQGRDLVQDFQSKQQEQLNAMRISVPAPKLPEPEAPPIRLSIWPVNGREFFWFVLSMWVTFRMLRFFLQ